MTILWRLQSGRSMMTNRRGSAKGVGPLVGKKPMPQQPPIRLSGVTRDSTGAALGNVSLEVFVANTGQLVERLTSDGSGVFTSSPVGLGQQYQIDAYLTGSPDRSGTTKNDLQGA
jgi:hypothetical protein